MEFEGLDKSEISNESTDFLSFYNDDFDDIVNLFINAKISGFEMLKFANSKTKEMMQQFVDNLNLPKKQLPIILKSNNETILKPNDDLEVTFGSYNLPNKMSNAFISATKLTENSCLTSKITVYPLSATSFRNIGASSYNSLGSADYVEIANIETINDKEISSTTTAFNVYSDKKIEQVQTIEQQSTHENPEDNFEE